MDIAIDPANGHLYIARVANTTNFLLHIMYIRQRVPIRTHGLCFLLRKKTLHFTKGELYYLFPHGGHAYCASRFPRPESHFGTYQKNHFELVDVAIDAPAQVFNIFGSCSKATLGFLSN